MCLKNRVDTQRFKFDYIIKENAPIQCWMLGVCI